MPIYEYECSECGKVFEVFLLASDKPVKKCDSCGSKKIHKLVSNCSFQLKGTGWYVTDYAKKDDGNGKESAKKHSDTEGSAAQDTKQSKESKSADSKKEKKEKTSGASSEKAA